jgi:hypothetical protein
MSTPMPNALVAAITSVMPWMNRSNTPARSTCRLWYASHPNASAMACTCRTAFAYITTFPPPLPRRACWMRAWMNAMILGSCSHWYGLATAGRHTWYATLLRLVRARYIYIWSRG